MEILRFIVSFKCNATILIRAVKQSHVYLLNLFSIESDSPLVLLLLLSDFIVAVVLLLVLPSHPCVYSTYF